MSDKPQHVITNLLERLAFLESKVARIDRAQDDLHTRCAWYYFMENRKCFAFITKLGAKGKADLIAFDANLAGGVNVVTDCAPFIYNEDVEPDEQVHAGMWMPITDLKARLSEAERDKKIKRGKPEEAKDEDDDSVGAS